MLVSDIVVRSTQNPAVRLDDLGAIQLRGMPALLHRAVPAT